MVPNLLMLLGHDLQLALNWFRPGAAAFAGPIVWPRIFVMYRETRNSSTRFVLFPLPANGDAYKMGLRPAFPRAICALST